MLKLRESFKMWALQGGTLKKVVVFVAAAFLCGNISHLITFRSVHPAFTGAQMLLDDLLIQ